MYHNQMDILKRAQLEATGQVDYVAGTTAALSGFSRGWGTTTGNSVQGWVKGAHFLNTSSGVVSKNSGTVTAATWVVIGAVDAANTWTALQAFAAGLSVASGQTAAIATADKLTVGGIIVPQHLEIVFRVSLHASTVIYNIFNCPTGRAYTVTDITYTTNVAQAITATVVKSTVNATPSSGTTPMHTANAISANTTIHNGTIVTLTSTVADLALAATDKIGLVLNSALTTGDFTVNISLKRV